MTIKGGGLNEEQIGEAIEKLEQLRKEVRQDLADDLGGSPEDYDSVLRDGWETMKQRLERRRLASRTEKLRYEDAENLSTLDDLDDEPKISGVDPQIEVRSEFARTLAANGYTNVLVLSRDRVPHVFQTERLEIIDYLDEHQPETVSQLAEKLHRDEDAVRSDLGDLAELAIIGFDDSENGERPFLEHDYVVIEPLY
jgi:hypothetical protein